MQWFIEAFKQHPERALFLALGLGYAIGKLRIAGQSFESSEIFITKHWSQSPLEQGVAV